MTVYAPSSVLANAKLRVRPVQKERHPNPGETGNLAAFSPSAFTATSSILQRSSNRISPLRKKPQWTLLERSRQRCLQSLGIGPRCFLSHSTPNHQHEAPPPHTKLRHSWRSQLCFAKPVAWHATLAVPLLKALHTGACICVEHLQAPSFARQRRSPTHANHPKCTILECRLVHYSSCRQATSAAASRKPHTVPNWPLTISNSNPT